MITVTVENDDTMVMCTEQGETWMELADMFFRTLLACGYMFDKDKVMDAVIEAHRGDCEEPIE